MIRTIRTLASIVSFVLAFASRDPAIGSEQASVLRAQDFVDAIGMNTKFKDIGSTYDDVSGSIRRFQYLGVRLLREGFPNNQLNERQLRGYHAFAAIGGRFTFVTHNEKPIPQIVDDIARFERTHPGSVKAVEGPNELNNWPITYQGLNGADAAKAYMMDLYAAVKQDPVLSAAGVAVYGATSWPPIPTRADFANVHSYERNAFASHDRLKTDRDHELIGYALSDVSPPGRRPPWVVTETGYHTWIGSGWFEGVEPAVQGQLGLMLLLNVAELGGSEVQWYQLQDAWGKPRNGEEAFGVFDEKGAPKPLASAIHNLTALLADAGPTAKTFATTPLQYSLSGNLGRQPHDGVYHLMMEKSDGAHILAIWRECELWDMQAKKPISVAPETTTVEFADPVNELDVYDPIDGANPVNAVKGVSRIDLSLAGHPLLLTIR